MKCLEDQHANVGRMAFLLFGVPVYWYGLMITAWGSDGTSYRHTFYREKQRFGLPKDTTLNLALWSCPSPSSAPVYYVAFTWTIQNNLWSVFNVRGAAGMAIYGSLYADAFLTGIVLGQGQEASFFPALWRSGRRRLSRFGTGHGFVWGNFFNLEPTARRSPIRPFSSSPPPCGSRRTRAVGSSADVLLRVTPGVF
jgi:phosphatidylglycerol:prolipoprotein diacylglycerol transferase